ncbi:hypothetical protein KY361_07810 [Candidatus Woesearchaeota archaeon]|nr:hypothetical protein [Candidatus Woesearchaeota archaeon]
MKKTFLGVICLMLCAILSTVGYAAIVATPTSVSATNVFAGENITGTVILTNTGGSPVTVTLPVSMTVLGPESPAPIIYVAYKNSTGYPLAGSTVVPDNKSVTLTYILHGLPVTTQEGAYTGTLRLGDTTNYVDLPFNLGIRGRMYIDDLTITVEDHINDDEDDDEGIENGDSVKAEIVPGATVTFEFEIGNGFDELEMEDVTVEVTIEDIDDGDDMEEESDEFEIGDDDTEDVEIEFEMPLELENGDYDAIIIVEGEDEEGNEYTIEWEITLEVEKESSFIYIKQAELTPATISCGGTVLLDLELMNLGSNDEDVTLEIKNVDLGIDIAEPEFEIEEDIDECSFEKTYTLDIPEDAEAGAHTLTIKAFYDNNDLSMNTVDLVVEECGAATTTTPTTATTTTPTTTTTQPDQTVINPPIITQPTQTSVEEESFTSTPAYMWILIIVNVIAVGVIVTLIVRKFVLKK